MSELQPAYLLHAHAWRETSLLLEMYSVEDGRLGVIARGVRGERARARAQRAALQAFQPLFFDWRGRGELKHLLSVEPAGAALPLRGKALLSGFYLNELMLRLVPRGEGQGRLFWRYVQCLGQLAEAENSLAWTLRCFERDLLEAIGYALTLDRDADDAAIEPDSDYWFETGIGPHRWQPGDAGWAERRRVSGRALLALARDACPNSEDLAQLRGLMRRVLLHHLGGRPLRSWQVLGEVTRRFGDDA